MTYADAIRTPGLTAIVIASRYGVPVREVMAARAERKREVDRAYRAQKKAPMLRAQAEAERARIKAELVAQAEQKAREKIISQMDPEGRDRLSMSRWLALDIRYENHPERPWNAGAAARNDAAFAARRAHHHTLGGVADYSSQPEAA